MRFEAKVLGVTGSIERIEIDASSQAEVEGRLRAEGHKIIVIKAMESGIGLSLRRDKFNLTVFNQQLCSLLEAGQSIVDAIDILQHNDSAAGDSKVYAGLLQASRQGRQLSDAMAQQSTIFPPLYVAMVRASETTGTVKIAIKRFMQYQAQVALIRGKLISASVYPAILVCVGMLVISFLMLYVVPRFSLAFDDVKAGGKQLGGFVYTWGTFVRAHGGIAWGSLGAVILGLLIIFLSPVTRNKGLSLLLKFPAVGKRLRVFQLARLYRTLGLLLRSGIPLTQALKMTRESMPDLYDVALDATRIQVEEGHALSRALARQQLATEVAARLVVAGESSGNLDEMLERVADFHDQEVAGWVDMIGRIIEPALMIGIGLIIGIVVMLLYMPIFELASSVQ